MDQQEQERPADPAPSPQAQEQGDQPGASSHADDVTWGLGSASALDHLRRHNFRGKRQAPQQDKPSSG